MSKTIQELDRICRPLQIRNRELKVVDVKAEYPVEIISHLEKFSKLLAGNDYLADFPALSKDKKIRVTPLIEWTADLYILVFEWLKKIPQDPHFSRMAPGYLTRDIIDNIFKDLAHNLARSLPENTSSKIIAEQVIVKFFEKNEINELENIRIYTEDGIIKYFNGPDLINAIANKIISGSLSAETMKEVYTVLNDDQKDLLLEALNKDYLAPGQVRAVIDFLKINNELDNGKFTRLKSQEDINIFKRILIGRINVAQDLSDIDLCINVFRDTVNNLRMDLNLSPHFGEDEINEITLVGTTRKDTPEFAYPLIDSADKLRERIKKDLESLPAVEEIDRLVSAGKKSLLALTPTSTAEDLISLDLMADFARMKKHMAVQDKASVRADNKEIKKKIAGLDEKKQTSYREKLDSLNQTLSGLLQAPSDVLLDKLCIMADPIFQNEKFLENSDEIQVAVTNLFKNAIRNFSLSPSAIEFHKDRAKNEFMSKDVGNDGSSFKQQSVASAWTTALTEVFEETMIEELKPTIEIFMTDLARTENADEVRELVIAVEVDIFNNQTLTEEKRNIYRNFFESRAVQKINTLVETKYLQKIATAETVENVRQLAVRAANEFVKNKKPTPNEKQEFSKHRKAVDQAVKTRIEGISKEANSVLKNFLDRHPKVIQTLLGVGAAVAVLLVARLMLPPPVFHAIKTLGVEGFKAFLHNLAPIARVASGLVAVVGAGVGARAVWGAGLFKEKPKTVSDTYQQAYDLLVKTSREVFKDCSDHWDAVVAKSQFGQGQAELAYATQLPLYHTSLASHRISPVDFVDFLVKAIKNQRNDNQFGVMLAQRLKQVFNIEAFDNQQLIAQLKELGAERASFKQNDAEQKLTQLIQKSGSLEVFLSTITNTDNTAFKRMYPAEVTKFNISISRDGVENSVVTILAADGPLGRFLTERLNATCKTAVDQNTMSQVFNDCRAKIEDPAQIMANLSS